MRYDVTCFQGVLMKISSALFAAGSWRSQYSLEVSKEELPSHKCIKHIHSLIQQPQASIAGLEVAQVSIGTRVGVRHPTAKGHMHNRSVNSDPAKTRRGQLSTRPSTERTPYCQQE